MIIKKYFHPILFSSCLHIWSFIFINDIFYFILVFLCTISSLMWHFNLEKYDYFFTIDYFFSTILTIYEILYSKSFFTALNLNIILFFINKLTDYLYIYNILSYEIGHSFFHFFSIFRIIIISKYL